MNETFIREIPPREIFSSISQYPNSRLVDEDETGSRHTPGFPSGFKEMRAGHPAVANRNRRHRSSVFFC